MNLVNAKELFESLYFSSTEKDVDNVIETFSYILNDPKNWYPLDNNESNFAVIENQQSSPIAALIEKITNSIDAILMRRCYELGIDPKSNASPRNMVDAVIKFFDSKSDNWYENWNLVRYRQKQAEEIQILADGPRMETSLVIYDNGEGQYPEEIENTFLSLLKGNKAEIPFVQGKYNMGGTGAIVFCGKKRYQLIGTKRYDGKGGFGFTLVREHPLNEQELKQLESGSLKNTWYEYFKIDEKIPEFAIDSLDLGLKGRKFITGSIIKLYSYNLPPGSRSVISRDLNQSINEYLFQPALPIFTIDKPERYPKDRNLTRELFGLKQRLEQEDSKYIEDIFSEEIDYSEIGKAKVTCYIFRNKIEDKTAKETKESISREFFKNNMAVLFSLNGQVHGHYTSEFITRTLKMPLLKNHLLIHVDCSNMNYIFRKELFMASRDRLKGSDETSELRNLLATTLGKGKLKEIYKRRKDSISFESGDTSELLKSFTKSIPLDSEIFKLLQNTFKIDIPKKSTGNTSKKRRDSKENKTEQFNPQRFPSIFKLKGSGTEEKPAAKIPLGGSRTVKFSTDVENQYFDRTEDPGDFTISLLSFKTNSQDGGKEQGTPKQLSDLLNISKSSPNNGIIKLSLSPTDTLQVGDLIQINAVLHGPGDEYEERFWVQIVDKEKPPQVRKEEKDTQQESWGLPQYQLIYKEKKDRFLTWGEFEEATGEEMEYSTIMHPFVEGDRLHTIYINMDSNVLKSHKSKIKAINEDQIELADKKYLSSVYFHTLFLFTISKQKKYAVSQEEENVELTDFLKDVFSSYYTEFLLNFGTEELMSALSI
ncbi:MAG: hypothetical protein ACFFDT_11135 [Candidatus Hodarchaeota archaeon]